ncbi:hypothetical protein PsorP6_011509 [Peronosclerospora sorghi]|uniref:Uncharacterized protein n=1 Tax=Peronosclerospora sorghi TaxID=230839 RepID=A0ACC0WJE5_9STRA|nr:hypothetical protein PsorP6_011509 [Peronosclerospora sorghi]
MKLHDPTHSAMFKLKITSTPSCEPHTILRPFLITATDNNSSSSSSLLPASTFLRKSYALNRPSPLVASK